VIFYTFESFSLLFCRFESGVVAKIGLKVEYWGTGGRKNGKSEEFKPDGENHYIDNGRLMRKYCCGFIRWLWHGGRSLADKVVGGLQ
jgi:hypothetical protein